MKKKKIDLFNSAESINTDQLTAIKGGFKRVIDSRSYDDGDSIHHDNGDSKHHDQGDSKHHDNMA